MSIILGIFFFILGTIIGSFLNVVILRHNTGRGVSSGRSICFSCGKELTWYELIPVFSFMFLGGRCSRCKSKISWQYPLVEFLTGITFLGVYLLYSFLLPQSVGAFLIVMLYTLVIMSLFIVIVVYDIRHKIIPDEFVFAVAALAFIRLFFIVSPVWKQGIILDFLAGPLLALPFALLWLVSSGKWMGLGDAKLTLAIGWILGLSSGISALILSFWIGAAASLIVIIVGKSRLSFGGKGLTMKSEIPFAPFLIIGFALVFFFSIHVIDLSIFFGPS